MQANRIENFGTVIAASVSERARLLPLAAHLYPARTSFYYTSDSRTHVIIIYELFSSIP